MNTLVTTTIKSRDPTKGLGHGPEAKPDFPQPAGSPGEWSVPSTTGGNGIHSDEPPFGTSGECTYETYEIDEINEVKDIKEPQEAKEREETQEIEEREETNELEERATVDELNPELSHTIDGAISACRVLYEGNVDRPLFMLAHEVRTIEEERNLHFGVATAAEIVRRWKASNQDQLENDYDYLTDFLCKLDLVRFPRGRALANALERAKNISPPKQTEPLSEGVQLLAKLCCILQQDAGKKPFFLDGRSAAKELGIPHRTVASWLHALCRVGVLVLVSKGHRGAASRYWYVAQA
jgi:hypothetical protein